MRKALYLSLVVLSSVLILASGCSKDNDGGGGGASVDCATVTNKAYAANISPIIQASCAIAGCHAAGSTNGPGPLTSYTEISNAKARIRTAVSSGLMPQGSSLSTAQKNSIICWIDGGAPNN